MNIYFDMDGTLANFYGVNGWLKDLEASNPRPYIEATPLFDFNELTEILHHLQMLGHSIGIVSWLSKTGTDNFNQAVTTAKMEWLHRHLPSVEWDEIHIVKYGTPKSTVVSAHGVLFDDEERNRIEWGGNAYDVQNILDILRKMY